MGAVNPAGLPQEPSPYEEDKLWYATSISVSFGLGGGFRRGLSSLAWPLPRSRTVSTTKPSSSRGISLTLTSDEYLLWGPSCGRTAALKVSPFWPLCSCPSPLRLRV